MEDRPKQKRAPRRKSEDCNWTCKYCNKKLRTYSELKLHQRECELKPLPDNNRWKCDKCDASFPTRSKLKEHMTEVHYDRVKLHRRDYGIKRPTSSHECPFCHRILVTCNTSFTYHVNHCNSNPDKKLLPKRKLSEETRRKISESMKVAAIEGRTHNVGECTWKGEKSYPEKWMTEVIENELADKNYVYNLRIGLYRLDFAWPKKMRYIEIDGDQHYTEYCIAKDKRRTEQLESLGWTLLRRSWSCIIKDKSLFIDEVKKFIDDVEDLPPEAQYRDKRKEELLAREKFKLNNPDIVDSLNRLNHNKVSDTEWNKRRKLILESGIDFSKFGWKKKVAKVIGISKRLIDSTVKKFPDDFKDAYKDAHSGKSMKVGG